MKKACAQLKTGALAFANGISSIGKSRTKVATLQLQSAYKDLHAGTLTLVVVRRQLLAIGGKGFRS